MVVFFRLWDYWCCLLVFVFYELSTMICINLYKLHSFKNNRYQGRVKNATIALEMLRNGPFSKSHLTDFGIIWKMIPVLVDEVCEWKSNCSEGRAFLLMSMCYKTAGRSLPCSPERVSTSQDVCLRMVIGSWQDDSSFRTCRRLPTW